MKSFEWIPLQRKLEQGTPLTNAELQKAFKSLDWFYGGFVVVGLLVALIIILCARLG